MAPNSLPSIHSLVLTAAPRAADQACAWLAGQCLADDLDPSISFQLAVCLAEAINNIVLHSDNAAGEIRLQCRLSAAQLVLDIHHAAPAYAFSRASSSDLLAESGRGSEIMHLWLDQVRYRHRNGINELRLSRRLAPRP